MINKTLKQANVVELKRGKKYLMLFNRGSVRREDLEELGGIFLDSGIDITAMLVVDGDPKTAVKVVEA